MSIPNPVTAAEAIPMAQSLLNVLQENGLRGIVLVVEINEEAQEVDGQPIYVSSLPRDAGIQLMQHVIDSATSGEIYDVAPQKAN